MGLTDVKLPNASADLVAVFDQDFNQVFADARPMRGAYSLVAKNMDHPVEDGTNITDHRVVLPVTIELILTIVGSDYRSVFNQIEQYFRRGDILTVQGRTKTYENMIISDMPYDEEPGMFDTISIALKLTEVTLVEAQYQALPAKSVQNPSDASTKDRGNVATSEDSASTEEPSLLYSAFVKGKQ